MPAARPTGAAWCLGQGTFAVEVGAERMQLDPAVRRLGAVGEYELAFHVGDDDAPRGTSIGDPVFLDKVVPLRFAVFDAKQHDHVPLLCTPWSCTTCRGS